MKRPFLIVTIILFTFLTACENRNNQNSKLKQIIDYSDKSVLDSLINATPRSKDSMFLGFAIGMTKTEYKNHIERLRKENREISYSKDNRITTIAGTYNLGAGYTFKTNITSDDDGKNLTGDGSYFFEPIYNTEGYVMKLNILPIEKWNGDYGGSKPKWLEKNIIENSESLSNEDLKKALIDNEIINQYGFIRKKNNLVIYKTSLTINYIDLKTLLQELLIKVTEKDIIEKDNKDIKF